MIDDIDIKNIDKELLERIKKSGYPRRGLYIYGDVGVGKTYTAIAIAKHISKNNFDFSKINDILRNIRSCEDAREESKKIGYYVKKRHLIIDDIGVEKLTEYSYNVIYEIIDKRCIYNPEAIIITSNLDIISLKNKFDKRIASRIIELCSIMEITGKDKRLDMVKKI